MTVRRRLAIGFALCAAAAALTTSTSAFAAVVPEDSDAAALRVPESEGSKSQTRQQPQAESKTAAAAETYDDYARIFQRSAGQFWADGKVAGQWAWNPTSDTESRISWGDPAKWPPPSSERFSRSKSGDWVLLDGWGADELYYKQRVSKEEIGDANCENLRAIPSEGGRQHYTKWSITAESYCLKASGTITESTTGKQIEFAHTQIWGAPAPCANRYLGEQTCITQHERWWDDNGHPGEMKQKLDRKISIARGLGMAFKIEQTFPKTWLAEMHDSWTW